MWYNNKVIIVNTSTFLWVSMTHKIKLIYFILHVKDDNENVYCQKTTIKKYIAFDWQNLIKQCFLSKLKLKIRINTYNLKFKK